MIMVAQAGMLLVYVYEVCCCCCRQQADRLDQRAAQAALPPPPLILPGFPCEAEGGRASEETMLCVICLDELRQGQLCSEVPACQHVFYRDCLRAWSRSNGSCPLRRAMIAQGSDGVPLADMTRSHAVPSTKEGPQTTALVPERSSSHHRER